jgi:hypothetical protein
VMVVIVLPSTQPKIDARVVDTAIAAVTTVSSHMVC